MPNQELLINLLPLLEAKDSPEIENIITTTDKLFQYANEDDSVDPATQETLRYRTALATGFRRLNDRPLTTNTAIDICSTINLVDVQVRSARHQTDEPCNRGSPVHHPKEKANSHSF